jgi:hypothetical protein
MTETSLAAAHLADDAGRRAMLRHALATVAYRGGKTLQDVPEAFAGYRAGPESRTPGEILAHMGDLMDWALGMADGHHRWANSAPLAWELEVDRFFAAVAALDARLARFEPLGISPERLFQGPVADALTHVGQIALLRGLAGAPVRGENYTRAVISAGRVGVDQPGERHEFD